MWDGSPEPSGENDLGTRRMNLLHGYRLSVALLVVGCWPASARAIEMFTNFNNGMEFNTRPIGIDQLPPVRYHSGQPAPGQPLFGRRCRDCEPAAENESPVTEPEPVPAPPIKRAPGGPLQLRLMPQGKPQPVGANSSDEDWLRGANFLPTGAAD
jgi:hypothetical protein